MILIRVFNSNPKYRVGIKGTLSIARYVLKTEKIKHADINIIFVDDKTIRKLNGKFLKRWNLTDVLSFTLNEDPDNIEGEVYINIDQARRQAKDYKVTYKNEYSRLIIHGLLHLIGYRDDLKKESAKMLTKEELLLNKLGKNSIL